MDPGSTEFMSALLMIIIVDIILGVGIIGRGRSQSNNKQNHHQRTNQFTKHDRR